MDMSTDELSHYKDMCDSFASELRDAIRDETYKTEGGKLFFAVDFSEIFAYLLPAKSYTRFFLFDHETSRYNNDETGAQALHQLLLKHIFINPAEERLLLLPPYVLELKTFARDLQTNVLDQLIRIVTEFKQAGRKILQQAGNDIGAILQKYDDEGEESLSEGEKTQVVNFVQQYGHILALSEDDLGSTTRARLRDFLEKVKFKSLQAFAQENDLQVSYHQTDIYPRWSEGLKKARKMGRAASADLDAVAMDIIGQINQQFQARGEEKRLLIFTRSDHMHNLFRREFNEDQWKGFGDYPLLRHPRVHSVLSMLSKVRLNAAKDITALAREELTPVEEFLDFARKEAPQGGAMPDNFLAMINQIQAHWEGTQALVLSTNEAMQPEEGQAAKIIQARKIFDLLKSNDIQQQVMERLAILLKDIDLLYGFLALNLPDPGQAATARPRYSMPYRLHFMTKEARELVAPFRREYSNREVVVALLKAFKAQPSYEMRLAIAYILALTGRWEPASILCEQALSLVEKDPVKTDGILLSAMCKRKLSGIDELADMRIDLERVVAASPNDPRGLAELGWLILLLDTSGCGSVSPEEGLALLDSAESKLVLPEDIHFWTWIASARLQYFLATRRLEDGGRLKDAYQKLQRTQEQIEPDEALWPPYILDTLAWAEWVLYYEEVKDDQNRIQKVIRRLSRAMNSSEINKQWEKNTVRAHLRAVQGGKKPI